MLACFISPRPIARFVALALCASWSGGCQVYDPSLVQRDAGADDGRCVGRQPPPRPEIEDGEGEPDLLFGLRDVVLNQGGTWVDIGFNLDGYCTQSPAFGHECEPVQSAARPQPDGTEGIDNTFGSSLYPLVETTVPGLEMTAREAQLQGNGLPALRLRGWNGEANDPRVHVTITQAVVAVPANEDGSRPDIVLEDYDAWLPDGSPAPPPNWDGRDYMWARADTFLSNDPEQPLITDDNAYVADNVLVVDLPDRIEILFATADAGVMVRLTGGQAVARISEDQQHLEDVIVAGRWSRVDLLRTAENVGICMGTVQYNALSVMMEGLMDVRSDPGSGGPDVPCDAVSLGVGFTGFRLQWGGVTDGRPLRNICEEMPPDGGVPDAGTAGDAGVDAGS